MLKSSLSIILLFFPLILLFSQNVKVIGISDGDSFTALFDGNRPQKIRLHGIDCPEYGQPYSNVAKKFLSDAIFNRVIYIKQTDKDQYGRIIALIYLLPDITLINTELLKAGLAWHYKRFDNNDTWSFLEQEAKVNKLGLWKDEKPIAPWIWRTTIKKKQNGNGFK